MNPSHTLFSKDEIQRLPEIYAANNEHTHALLERINAHLISEVRRCVRECPPTHLAHLAIGPQELGVEIAKDASSFSIRFTRNLDGGMPDPIKPYARCTFLLPDIPSIAQAPPAPDLIEEMVQLPGLSEQAWGQLLYRIERTVKLLAALMRNAEVTDEVRRRVNANFEANYLPALHHVPESILHFMCEQEEDKAWLKEHRRNKHKAQQASGA